MMKASQARAAVAARNSVNPSNRRTSESPAISRLTFQCRGAAERGAAEAIRAGRARAATFEENVRAGGLVLVRGAASVSDISSRRSSLPFMVVVVITTMDTQQTSGKFQQSALDDIGCVPPEREEMPVLFAFPSTPPSARAIASSVPTAGP